MKDIEPLTAKLPLTSNLAPGVVVPMPTLLVLALTIKISLLPVALMTKLLDALLPINHCSVSLVFFIVNPR